MKTMLLILALAAGLWWLSRDRKPVPRSPQPDPSPARGNMPAPQPVIPSVGSSGSMAPSPNLGQVPLPSPPPGVESTTPSVQTEIVSGTISPLPFLVDVVPAPYPHGINPYPSSTSAKYFAGQKLYYGGTPDGTMIEIVDSTPMIDPDHEDQGPQYRANIQGNIGMIAEKVLDAFYKPLMNETQLANAAMY